MTTADEKDDGLSMPFLDHLQELRGCLIRISIWVLIGSITCFVWSDKLFSLLTEPLHLAFNGVVFIGTGPAEAFTVKLTVAMVAGVLLTSPYLFFELWRFISPGLHLHERKTALPFVFFSTFFFLIGVSFCFLVVFPFTFSFFMEEFVSIGVSPTIRIGEYLEFAVKLLATFGAVFELPVLTFFLSRLGIVSDRWLIEKFRYATLIIFIVAGVLTPPDVLSQLLLAGPLMVLYGMCILIAHYVKPSRELKPS